MHTFAALLAVILLIFAVFFMPVNSTDQVTDFQTLAQYVHHVALLMFGNLLVWLSVLTRSRDN